MNMHRNYNKIKERRSVMIEMQGNKWVCAGVCFGGCLAGCAAGCMVDGPFPIADVVGATLVNASASTASMSACNSAL